MQANAYILDRLKELALHKSQFERAFYFLEDEELFFIPEGEKWSAIECIEHINNVNEVYLPQLTKVCQLTDAKRIECTRDGLAHEKSTSVDATDHQGKSTKNSSTKKTKTTPPQKSKPENCPTKSHGELHFRSQSD